MKVKAILPIAIFLVLFSFPVQAQGLEPPIPPAPSGGNYVLDELNWLTSEQEIEMNSIIRKLDREGVAEVAVVTLNDCGSDKLAFRKTLFDSWGIGHANDDDGLLILVCWYDGDTSRRSVEQLYGRGLNEFLTSNKTEGVAKANFVSSFEKGKPGNGLVSMVRSYNVLLRARPGTIHSSNPIVRYVEELPEEVVIPSVLLLLAASLLVLDKLLPHSVRKWIEEKTRSSHEYTSERLDRFDRLDLSDRSDRSGNSDRGGSSGGRSGDGGGSSTRF